MSLPKEIPELIKAGVITPDTADRIRTYYQNRDGAATNPLFIVFGILGAILVGLGIILIIAHNWDQLSLAVKTILAFIPLLSGQGICAYALLKKRNTTAWREGGSAFLFLSIGACISLIGQIYHVPGDLHSFLLSCLLLGLPLVYVMQSSVSSLLYIIGISFYATETGYWSFPSSPSYVYGLMLLAVLPHYYRLCIKKPHSNFVSFHNWIIPLSLTMALGTVAHKDEELMFVAYFSLFGLFYLVGKLAFFEKLKPASNGYKVLGAAGTTVLLMVLSFDWFWEDLRAKTFSLDEIITTPEFLVSGILTIMATSLLFRNIRVNPSVSTKPMAFIFLLFIPTFILGTFSAFATLLINVYVLIIGIFILRNGVRQDHLGLLNYGLLIISVLAICRFFDRDLSFVVRGILFVTVGIGFFAANYYTLKNESMNQAKLIVLIAFVGMALLQWYIPARMILSKTEVLESGVAYKFRTAPLDPTDPFRGKYITLSYEDSTIDVEDPENWIRNETVYALITADSLGFARIKAVSKKAFAEEGNFIKTKVSATGPGSVSLEYPFDRFYMEEHKAPRAEKSYRQALQDSSQITYALVYIKNGDAVLSDVVINGVSVKDLAQTQ